MQRLLLHISLIDSCGPAVVTALQRAGLLSDELYTLSAADIAFRAGITAVQAARLVTGLGETLPLLEQELKYIEKAGCTLITRYDAAYPTALASIHAPPTVLYVAGTLPTQMPMVAFVGARLAGAYVERSTRAFVPELVKESIAIVSGGAVGADTFAHEAVLENNGVTVSVIGAGLLRPYPAQNRRLFERIVAQGGAVVSPFPLTMSALPGNFPARNRIIAGMSQATIVLQAAQKSGALITARFALDEGREVGAVPGAFDDPLSVGCHALLKEGAQVITSAVDIMALLGMTPVKEHQMTLQPAFSSSEQALLELCKQPQSFDELLSKTALSAGDLTNKLCALQLAGAVEQTYVGAWRTCP